MWSITCIQEKDKKEIKKKETLDNIVFINIACIQAGGMENEENRQQETGLWISG